MMAHPKQSNTLVDPRNESLAPARPVRGEPPPIPLVIREAGLAFRVRLGDGLKTGIFLDQRENRRRVRELARGKRVLNLFAYTCGFTVAAAAGGARRTASVDASKGRARVGRGEPRSRTGCSAARTTRSSTKTSSVWLKLANKRRERYDLVVLDPPSYATTKSFALLGRRRLPRARRARAGGARAGGPHARVHQPPRASRFASSESRCTRPGGSRVRAIAQLKDLPSPLDFPAAMGGEPHLKSLFVTVK